MPLRTKQLEGDSIGLSATRISGARFAHDLDQGGEHLRVGGGAQGRRALKATLGLITTTSPR
jgi:hypothetical protein